MEREINVFSSQLWTNEGAAQSGDVINAVFVIKRDQSVLKKFENQLLDLATPTSKNYGKWLSKEEIISQISPAESSVRMVKDYLQSFGVSGQFVRMSEFQDKVFAQIPASRANELFATEFSRFRSVENSDIVLIRATKGYSLPQELADVVSLVDDIVRFPSIRRSRLTPASDAAITDSASPFSSCGAKCNGMTTPAVLQAAYGYSPVTSVAKGNTVAVAEFQYQYYDNADLSAFSTACGVTVTVDETIGGNNERICNTGCVEALLDIEYIGAIVHPIPLTTIYSSTFSLLEWVDNVIAMKNPALVHSVSYGNDEVQQTSAAYMNEVNVQFQIAGTMGLSILFASGDQGVWGRSGVGATYHPDFPAGSPYVTSVGGTNFAAKSVVGEESAWSCGGGGFSDNFAAPEWQKSFVADYFAAASAAGVLPAANLFNATGRGYPDVAALGGQTNPYCVAVKGGSSFSGVAGTSASCPVVAGIFAQLNNARLAAGKPSMGWLNPFIYSNGGCFNDVKDGSMNNCNAGTTGFAALPGWDPATGFGSPNYSCLEAKALAV